MRRRNPTLHVLRSIALPGLGLVTAWLASLVYSMFFDEVGLVTLLCVYGAPGVIITLTWLWRSASTIERIEALEAGRMCLGCESRDVAEQAGVVACAACGLRTSLARLRENAINQAEIERIQTDNRGRFG